uniref:Calponin n=1 Tax=Mandrillus leucophaeus TaxID=9568 RepID=A0A2K5YIK9_MANLE
MSSTQFNKDSSYRLSAEVKNRLLRPGKEAELCSWIQGLTGLSLCPDFQKGLKDGTVLRTLINKLQQSSVPKINRSMQNWHQLENLSNFIKEGMNTVDLFEASDLFESGNMRQVQVSLLALVGKMGTNKCTSQSGMTADGTRRHLYNPKNHLLPPMDHSTISLQMGTNKCASQVGFWTPGTLPRHPVDTKLGTDKCDNSSMSLQMGYTQSAKQSGQVFGLGRDCPGLMEVPEYPPYFQEEAGY